MSGPERPPEPEPATPPDGEPTRYAPTDFMARHEGMRPGESYLLAVRDRAFP